MDSSVSSSQNAGNQVRKTQKFKKLSEGGPLDPPTNSCIFKLTISSSEQFIYALPHSRFFKKCPGLS